MSEVIFAVSMLLTVLVFGVALPLYLIASWVYQDAKHFEPISDWLTPRVWVLIVIFSNYVGLIIYLIVRKSFAQKQSQCQLCGDWNQNEANFCSRCGEPLAWPVVGQISATSYKKLIAGGICFFLAVSTVIGSSIYYAMSSNHAPFAYSSGITWMSHKKGGVNQGHFSRDFTKIAQAKEVFYVTTKNENPHFTYELKAVEGEIELEVLDIDGQRVFTEKSPSEGDLSLQAETKYQVVVKIEMAKDGRFAFDWR